MEVVEVHQESKYPAKVAFLGIGYKYYKEKTWFNDEARRPTYPRDSGLRVNGGGDSK